jgi:hypothetical protein
MAGHDLKSARYLLSGMPSAMWSGASPTSSLRKGLEACKELRPQKEVVGRQDAHQNKSGGRSVGTYARHRGASFIIEKVIDELCVRVVPATDRHVCVSAVRSVLTGSPSSRSTNTRSPG